MSPASKKRRLAVFVLLLAGLAMIGCGALLWLVHRVVHPPRVIEPVWETVKTLVRYEDVKFRSADGILLSGWLFPGKPSGPAVVLCHDAGASKAALMNVAVPLQKAGFTALAFDFRGHGESDGKGTSLGIAEARDIVGAVRFLAQGDGEDRAPVKEFGVYGVGMGAHAAILAAREEMRIRTLVLDGLYPDAGWRLCREMFGSWEFGARWLAGPGETAFNLLRRTRIERFRAADTLPMLTGREVLLIAPAGDHELAEQVRLLYETTPEQHDSEGNLLILPSAGTGTLVGENMHLYLQRTVSFFTDRLKPE